MLRLINLKGGLTGYALLETNNRATTIELHCRRQNSSLSDASIAVYLVSGTAVKRVRMEGLRGETEPINARAVLIADGEGRIIAEGANGLSEAALERAKTKVRLTGNAPAAIAKTADAGPARNKKGAQQSSGTAAISGTEAAAPASSITQSILDSAKLLFSRDPVQPVYADNAEKTAKAGETLPKSENSLRVDNPFPVTLPGAVWQRTEPDGSLFGTASIRGIRREFFAIPVENDPARKPAMRFLRRTRGRDGKTYLLYMLRQGARNGPEHSI